MKDRKKILITGSQSFIGKYLINQINKKNKIKILKYKSLEKKNIMNIKNYINKKLNKIKPETVIHLATYFTKKKDKITQNKTNKINFLSSKILLELSEFHKVKKFIYLGSNHEFIKNKKLIYPYLISKKKFSSFTKKFKNFNTTIVGIYLHQSFGENDKRNKIIPYLLKVSNKSKINIFYQKNLSLNFVSVETICKILKKIIAIKLLKKKNYYSLINRQNIQYHDILKKVKKYKKNIFISKNNKHFISDEKIKNNLKKIYTNKNKDNILKFIDKQLQ